MNNRFKYYRGWHIFGSGNQWAASRHGVDLTGNSEALLHRMIDLRSADDPYTTHTKDSPARRVIEAAITPAGRVPDGTPNPNVSFHGVTLRDFLGPRYDDYVTQRRAIWAKEGPLFSDNFYYLPAVKAPGVSMQPERRSVETKKARELQALETAYGLDHWRAGTTPEASPT